MSGSLFIRILEILMLGTLFGLLLALPNVNDPSLIQSTLTTKLLLLSKVSLLTSCLFVLRLTFDKQFGRHFRISKIDVLLALCLLFIILNRYFIQSRYGFSIRLFDLFGLTFMYVLFRNLSSKDYPWLLIAVIVSGIFQAVAGSLQSLGFSPSLNSGLNFGIGFFNSGPYGGFLAVVWSVALGMYLFKNKILSLVVPRKKPLTIKGRIAQLLFQYIPLVGMATIITVVPAIRSRSAWLSVLITSLVLVTIKYKYLEKIKSLGLNQKILWGVILSIVIGVGFYGAYNYKKNSADGRILIWKVSTNIIKSSPFFGVGHDRFKSYYMDAQANYFVKNKDTEEGMLADNSYYAFNDGLQFLAENGIIGFLLMSNVLFFSIISKTIEKVIALKVVSLVTLLSIFVFGLFSYPMQILPIKLIGVLALSIIATNDVKSIRVFSKGSSRPFDLIGVRAFKASSVFLVVVLIWVSYPRIKNMEHGFNSWKNALMAYHRGSYVESVLEFESLLPLFKREGDYLMNYGKALVMSHKYEEAIMVLVQAKHYLNTTIIETALGDAYKATGHYMKAEKAYNRAANMIPNRFYPHYLLAQLYKETGQTEKANRKANELLNKEIKVSSSAIRDMKAEMKLILEEPVSR